MTNNLNYTDSLETCLILFRIWVIGVYLGFDACDLVLHYFCEIMRSASLTLGKTFGKISRLITPSARIEKR